MEIPGDWSQATAPRRKFGARWAVFEEDRKSFQAFILSDQVRDPTEQVAKEIMALAKSKTPRGSDRKRKGAGSRAGHIQDKFTVQRSGGQIVVGGDHPYPRVRVYVKNSHPRAATLEFGSSRAKKVRMLGRAGAAFGDFKGGKTTRSKL